MRTWKEAEPEVKVAILPCEGDCDGPTLHRFDFPRWLESYLQFWFKCQTCGKRRLWGTAVHSDAPVEEAA